MASPELALKVAPSAVAELAGIWQWNVERYDRLHADEYLAFLTEAIRQLPATCQRGKCVPARPDLRHLMVRRKRRGHGHIVVYRFDETRIDVLHVFHSAQDWQARLSAGQHE